jgi:hypothetical protein
VSEALEPALPDHLDRQAERLKQHFGPMGRGAIRVQSPKVLLDLLEQSLEEE